MKYRISKSEDNTIKVLVDENLIKFLEEHYLPDKINIDDPVKVLSHLPGNTELYMTSGLKSMCDTSHLSIIDHEPGTYAFASIDYIGDKKMATITVRRGVIVDIYSYEYNDDHIEEMIVIVDYTTADIDEDCIMKVKIYPILMRKCDIGNIKLIRSMDDNNIYLIEDGNLYDIERLEKTSDHLPENYEEV